MTKYTNPFYTITEAMAVLKSLGADPKANTPAPTKPASGATYPFPWGNAYGSVETTKPDPAVFHGFAHSPSTQIDWREHILSICVQAVYENSTQYFTCAIHMTNEGFDALMELLGEDFAVSVEPHLAEFEEHYVEPSLLLRLFKLVTKK